MSKTETYRFRVTTNTATDHGLHKIDAAYYTHEERFTVFKATDGGILASFANDHIVAIEREVLSASGGAR